jgi:hypothetical protein
LTSFSIISSFLPLFSMHFFMLTRSSKNYIVGVVVVPEVWENQHSDDALIVVPPTLKIADAAIAAHCMWERINPNVGRDAFLVFPRFMQTGM